MGNPVLVDNATLIHADSRKAFAGLADHTVHLIATDPPYFIDGMGDDWSDKDLKSKVSRARAIGGLPVGMKFDPRQGRRLELFIRENSEHAARVLVPGGYFIAFSQPRLSHRMAVAMEDVGFEIRDMIIWEHEGGQGKAFTQDHFVKKMPLSDYEKQQLLKSLDGRKTPQLRPMFETIIVAQKPREGTFIENWLKWNTGLIRTDFDERYQQSTILKYNKPKGGTFEHMTVKPVDVMRRLIDIFSVPDQIVLDPFMGSGTTAIAALSGGRKFIGFDIEEKYVRMTRERIVDFVNNGNT